MIKNLVLKGGGVLGQAYTGAILELDKRGIMSGIERVAGTSAGAIVACLITLKYSSKEIFDISAETNFKTFEDGRLLDKINVGKRYGINPGKVFLAWMREKIVKKGLPGNATFADFRNAGMLDFSVFAVDLNEDNLKTFSYERTPNKPVAEAVRASMSIPLFFEAFQFFDTEKDDHIYVDGGMVFNYPLACFDKGFKNPETLGLFVGELNEPTKNNNLTYGHFIRYAKAFANTILKAQNINLTMDAEDMSRTIEISGCGVSPTNFSLTTEDKMKLFEAGRKAVIEHFMKL